MCVFSQPTMTAASQVTSRLLDKRKKKCDDCSNLDLNKDGKYSFDEFKTAMESNTDYGRPATGEEIAENQIPIPTFLPCPFTGPKMFWAGPNFLCQTKR